MANNNVTINIVLDDKGSLKKVTSSAQKTAQSFNQVAASANKATKAHSGLNVKQNTTNKLEKSLYQNNLSAAKGFSKQAQTLGGTLVPAYATLAANIFALTAAFGALQRAAAFEQLQQGLIMVGSAAGQNLPYVADQLREITGAAVSAQSAMSTVALGTASGFSTKQLEDLTKVAKGASLALGRNMEDALSRLVRGTAKVEPEILDELGIMVRLDAAVQKYATSIGKTGEQLTQFERSQAFLNATIEEGLEKFSFVAENVDPNPYDRLASAFNNLQKEGFKVINKFLTPLIELLSTSPSALIGTLTLFGATIIGKIVPGLNELILKQQKLAAATALQARAAKKTVSQQYIKQQHSLNKVFSQREEILGNQLKSLGKYEAALKAGNLTQAQSKAMVQTLQKSEQLRLVSLNQNTKKSFDLKQKELLYVQRLIEETKRLQAAEASRFQVSAKESLARARSRMSTRQAGYLGAMDTAGILGSFAIAGRGAAKHMGEINKVTGAWNKAIVASKAFSRSVSLLGRAFLRLIPVLGQVLFIWGLISPLIEKFTKNSSKVAETVDEVVNSFESFDAIAKQLNERVSIATRESEKYLAVLRAEVGVLDQVASGLRKVQQVRREEAIKARIELAREAYEQSKKLQELDQGQGAGYTAEYQRQYDKVRGLRQELSATFKEISDIDAQASIDVLVGALTALEGIGNTTDVTALSNAKEGIQELLNEVISGGTFENLQGRINEIMQETGASALRSFDTIQSAIQNFDKETIKLANKTETQFDKMISALDAFDAEYRSVLSNPATAKEFIAQNEEIVDKINAHWEANAARAWQLFPALEFSMEGGGFEEARAELFIQDMKAARQIIVDTKGEIAQYAVSLKSVNKLSKEHPEAMTRSLELQESIVKAKLRELDATNQINGMIQVSLKDQEKRKALELELARLESIKEALVQKSALVMKDKLLKYSTEIVKQSQKYRDILEEIAQIQDNIASAQGTASAQAQYETLLRFEEQRQRKIEETAKIEADQARIKYGLMQAENVLLKANAEEANVRGANIDLSVFDTYAELLNWGLESTLLTVGAQKRLNIEKEKELRIQKALAAQQEARDVEFKLLELEKGRLEMGSSEVLTSEKAIELSKAKVDWLEQQLFLSEDQAERARLAGEIEAETNKILQERVNISDELAKRMGEIGGELVGAQADMFSSLFKNQEILGSDDTALSEKAEILRQAFAPMVETLSTLGPDGELAQAVAQGAFVMTEVWVMAFEIIGDSSLEMKDKIHTSLSAVAASISAIGSIQAASSDSRIASIESEIEAEKKRDGKTAKSKAKIKALEKKAEQEKRKAFEQNKKMRMAEAVISTAAGIARAFADHMFPMSAIVAGIVGAMGALQLAAINSATYNGGGATAPGAPTKISVGERQNTVDLATSRSPYGELSYMRGGLGTGASGANNYVPSAFMGSRAMGGNTGYLVGEQGPELFVPERPGTIIPADDTERVSPATNVTFNINAIDTQGMEEALMKQRGNMIRMFREAANSHGEYFLESVNVFDD